MNQSLEERNIKNESTDSASSDRLKILTQKQVNSVREESDCLVPTEIYIKTEPQEDENEILVISGTSYEICRTDNVTDEPMIKIQHEDLLELLQDPLDCSSDIKDKEHFSIDLGQGIPSIKIEPTKTEKDENLLKIDQDDLHGNGSNQGQNRLLIRNDVDHKDKKYVCYICSKTFVLKGNLDKHLHIHTGEKPFTCNVCNKSFTLKSYLNRHILIHSCKYPYICDVCKKNFNNKANLIRHKLIHNKEKPFSCDECNKSFVHKQQLLVHKRIHTGEKPFICDLCNKAFGYKSVLTLHKRFHAGGKPYSCDICSTSFTDRSNLNRHKKRHKK